MPIYEILTDRDPTLTKKSKLILNFNSEELTNLISDLFENMHYYHGIGLAAPQIGISKRIFVYGVNNNKRYPDVKPIKETVIINPEILWISDNCDAYNEKCLSVPNVTGSVIRSKKIRLSFFDANGLKQEKYAEDFEARIILHELDHLNGILFTSKASNVDVVETMI